MLGSRLGSSLAARFVSPLPAPRSLLPLITVRHAGKQSGGTGGVTRTSNPKYLGVKIFGDQFAKRCSIIVRQRGQKWAPGENVGMGRDFTLWAKADGYVEFERVRKPRTLHYVHVREETKEEHDARMASKVAARAAEKERRLTIHAPHLLSIWKERQAEIAARTPTPPGTPAKKRDRKVILRAGTNRFMPVLEHRQQKGYVQPGMRALRGRLGTSQGGAG